MTAYQANFTPNIFKELATFMTEVMVAVEPTTNTLFRFSSENFFSCKVTMFKKMLNNVCYNPAVVAWW